MKKHNLLQKLPGGEERYEIAPALRLIFPAEQIQALTALYQQLQNHAAPNPIPAEDDEP